MRCEETRFWGEERGGFVPSGCAVPLCSHGHDADPRAVARCVLQGRPPGSRGQPRRLDRGKSSQVGGADRIATRDGGCTLSDPAEGVGALRCFGTQPQYRIRVGVEMKRRLDERKRRMLGRGFQLPCKPTRPLQPAVGNRVDPRIAP